MKKAEFMPPSNTAEGSMVGEKVTYDKGCSWRKDLAAGTCQWAYHEDAVYSLYFVCPCGCGAVGALPVSAGAGGWKWDGNMEAPTTTPSIRMCSPCGWHGYLKKGQFEPC